MGRTELRDRTGRSVLFRSCWFHNGRCFRLAEIQCLSVAKIIFILVIFFLDDQWFLLKVMICLWVKGCHVCGAETFLGHLCRFKWLGAFPEKRWKDIGVESLGLYKGLNKRKVPRSEVKTSTLWDIFIGLYLSMTSWGLSQPCPSV